MTCSNSERFCLALSLLQGHSKGLLEVLGIPAFKKYDRYSSLIGKEGGVVQGRRGDLSDEHVMNVLQINFIPRENILYILEAVVAKTQSTATILLG